MVFKTIITLFAAIASIEAGIGHVSYAAYPYSFPLNYPYAVPAQYAAVRAVAPVAPVATAPLVKALPAVPAVPAVAAVRAAPFVRALPAVPAVQAVAPAPVVRAAPFVAPVVKSAIAPVAAAPIAAAPVAAAKIDYADAYPQYQYAYSIQDVITGDNKAQEEIREGDVVKGRYSLLEADGSRRTVDYYADPLNGFNAIVQKELPVVAAAPVVKAPVAVAAYPKEAHWRLSHHENFSRMRLKLIPNLHFDSHKDASNLRDNTGWSKLRLSEEIALPLNISQAALRQESDFSVEQSSEAELFVNTPEESELENKSDFTQGTEKLLITCDCDMVTLMSVIKGKVEITTSNFYFYDLSQIKEDSDRHDFKWSINKLREIYLRRYNLRKTALEFFLTDQTNYFLNFNKEVRNNVFTTLMKLRPPNLLYHSYKSPSDLLRSSGLTQKWMNREITNFDYLMQLNTIAGRTYNDLSQYPVFPWILADYESEELNLNDPATFRDLSRPIGVVNPANEAEVRSKYNTFEDPCGIIAKFHYGTHYSNSAGVLHYLVRVEPFTTLHIDLQSGRFDVADRQFHSIPQTWKLLMENPNDVKELIPEFFYFPEFLKNLNKFDLGVLQGTKEKVDDVILPKWASNPEDFIFKHRKALESEYVSSHLHEWIDLIFGYKQRGQHAIKALNVFYYCSYEGAVDLDAIEDPTEREAVEGMINNFGQTPSQLLKEPHPKRQSLNDALLKMLKTDFKKPDLTLFFDQLTHFQTDLATDRDPVIFLNSPRSTPRGFLMSSVPDALITVSRSGFIGMHSWTPHDRYSAKGFSIVVDESVNNSKWRRDLSGSFHPSIKLHNKLFVVSHDSKFLFSAGHWDYSIKIFSLTKNKYTHSLLRHTDLVTCLAADSCGWYLISGSKDCTSVVWDINTVNIMSPKPYQLLHGHNEPISCVAIATELDMAVSGSLDGTVNVYTIHEGHLVHTLTPEGCVSPIADVTFVTISVQGQIAFSVTDKVNHSIHVYSINGVNLGSKYVLGQVTSLTTINDCVIVTDDAGDLTISRLLGLHPMFSIPLHVPIQTAVSTSGNTHLLVPLRDGHLVVIGLPNN